MSDPDHASILKFLSKPRFVHEVADHYGISTKLAAFHIQKAVDSAQVLISEKPVLQAIQGSKGKLKTIKGFLYVSRISPMLTNNYTKWRIRETDVSIQGSKDSHLSMRFISKTHASFGKDEFGVKRLGIVFEAPSNSKSSATHLKTNTPFVSQFELTSPKEKLVRRRAVDQFAIRGTTRDQSASLSYVEKARMFQALLKMPISYLDLHTQFGVSRQTIKRLVSNGLLKEMWGSKAIGLRFQLTNRGKRHARELEAATIYEHQKKERSFIRLKSRVPH
jgi:hypothetical protein